MSVLRRIGLIVLAVVVVVVVLAVIAFQFMDGPLTRWAQRQMNKELTGYSVRLGHAHFHPIGLALDLNDLTLVQNAYPDPPVAKIPRLHASLHWRALLHGAVVADILLDRPVLRVDRRQTTQEAESGVPVTQRGWQDAILAVYPLDINLFRVHDGAITYVESGPTRPLRLDHLNLRAENIRNVRSPDRTYPSDLFLDATVFETGHVRVVGNANFLEKPYAGVKAHVDVRNMPLDYFDPLLARNNLFVRKGTLSLKGNVEYAPRLEVVDLESATVDGLDADYRQTPAAVPKAKRATHQAVEKTKEVSNQPGILIRAREMRITHATLGYVDETKKPAYRVFLADADVTVQNFTNQLTQGTAAGVVTGKFMGSGNTRVTATFRPETNGPDFDLAVKIENTDMRAMNALWRTYGNIEVESGLFSFYSELAVKNHAVRGYVKPLMKDVAVVQHKKVGLGQKVKEHLAEAAAKILKNPPRQQVATVTNISGQIENPKASIWQTVVNLVRNAFFKAILPGFLRETRAASG